MPLIISSLSVTNSKERTFAPTSHHCLQQHFHTTTTMAATLAGMSLSSTTRTMSKTETPRSQNSFKLPWVNCPWKTGYQSQRMGVRMASASSTPERIAEKVQESIKNAEEVCAGDAASGECVAAWDEVEEVSAAASHARERQKDSDPLENYCKDNPETDECKTYDN